MLKSACFLALSLKKGYICIKIKDMKEKDLFIKALSSLFFSWGSEAPAEVFWGANDLLDWFEKEHNVQLGIRFDEENPDNYNDVIETIKNS